MPENMDLVALAARSTSGVFGESGAQAVGLCYVADDSVD